MLFRSRYEGGVAKGRRGSLDSSLIPHPSSLEARVLNQMARELLLAQSSDWAFQIFQGTTVEYSSRRFQSHIHRFDLLAKMLEESSPPYEGGVAKGQGGSLSADRLELLTEIESRDNIFPEIDYRVYQTSNQADAAQ